MALSIASIAAAAATTANNVTMIQYSQFPEQTLYTTASTSSRWYYSCRSSVRLLLLVQRFFLSFGFLLLSSFTFIHHCLLQSWCLRDCVVKNVLLFQCTNRINDVKCSPVIYPLYERWVCVCTLWQYLYVYACERAFFLSIQCWSEIKVQKHKSWDENHLYMLTNDDHLPVYRHTLPHWRRERNRKGSYYDRCILYDSDTKATMQLNEKWDISALIPLAKCIFPSLSFWCYGVRQQNKPWPAHREWTKNTERTQILRDEDPHL